MNIIFVLLPLFGLILLGYGIRRVMDLKEEFWPQLDKFIYFIFIPALMFHSISRSEISFGATSPLIIVCILAMGIGITLGYIAKYFFQVPAKVSASGFQGAFRFNSYLGIAIAASVFGNSGASMMSLVIGFLVPLANVAAVWALAKHGDGKMLRQLITNPLIIATVLGIAFNLTGLRLPDFLHNMIGLVSQAALGVGLIAVGANLKLAGLGQFRGIFIYYLAVKLLILPAVGWGLSQAIGLSSSYLAIAVIFCTLPPATSAYVLAARMGGDGQFVAAQITVATVCAIVTIPMWLSLIGL